MRQRGFRARRREQRAGAKSGALACMYSSALWRTLARKSRQRELGSRWREIRTGAKSTAPARDSRQRAGSRASMSVAPARSRVALARTSRWLAPLRAGAYAAPARRAHAAGARGGRGGARIKSSIYVYIYLYMECRMAIDGRCGAVACTSGRDRGRRSARCSWPRHLRKKMKDYNSQGCRCARARLGERRVARVDATL